MPLEVRPIPKLTYKLRLTPQMRLSLNLLQLPLTRLKEYIKEEIEKNPVLEPIDREPMCPKEEKVMPWTEEDEEKREYQESIINKPPTLQDHLLRQLHLLVDSEDERKIGELIIGNINDDGYLKSSIEDISELSKITEPKVEKVLTLIRTFDPVGVGARDLRECLLLQLKAKGDLSAVANLSPKHSLAKAEENSLAGQIIDRYLPFLEKKRYEYIAEKLKVSIDRIKDAMKEIARLEPKPGRSFSIDRALPLIPDAALRKTKEGYEVILNDWELPRITINEKYRKMIKQSNTPEDTREYLRERFRAAKSLIHAVERRKETIQKVIEDIVYVQKGFFDNGGANFKPMTLEQIAKRIGKHKSTVSRAINNKFLHTPHGIFELRHFLSSGVKQNNGEVYSSKNIKNKMLDLTKGEDKTKPLTDNEIADKFIKEGILVARRTISKYREQLKILPSKSRRE